MPIITAEDTEETFEWNWNTFVGRGLLEGLSFDAAHDAHREISSLHAALTWNRKRKQWQVHDLGSQNGTFIDGAEVEPGKPAPIGMGSKLVFGRLQWKVVDAAPPPARAQCRRTGAVVIATDGSLLLPDESAPQVALVHSNYGWVTRDPGDDLDPKKQSGTPIQKGGSVTTDKNRVWDVWLPSAEMRTVPVAGTLAAYEMVFSVSADFDTIRLTLQSAGHALRVPSRRHTELLWLLARARLDDRKNNVSREDAGWVKPELMVTQMALRNADPVAYLNLLVHRARNQVSGLGIIDGHDVIERDQTRGLRIGSDQLREIIEAS